MKGKGLRKMMKIEIESEKEEEEDDLFCQSMKMYILINKSRNKDGEIKFINEKINISKEKIQIENNLELHIIPAEDLELGEVVGRGSAGTVLKGVHKSTGRPVAVKSINIYDKEKR